MARYTVATPVAGHSGAVGGVTFTDGAAAVDDETHAAELAYFRQAGYRVDDLAPVTPGPVAPPKRSASTPVWRTYAVEHGGMTAEEAADLSRDQLAERFTSTEEISA